MMIEVRTQIPSDLADPLEDHFCEYVGVSPWSLFNEAPGRPYFLSGFFPTEPEALAAWAELRTLFPAIPERPDLRKIEDKEWQEAYKAYLKPWSSRGLHWVPVWERDAYTVPAGEFAVYLDAGMAFGTGSHETTRLCAQRMLDFREARTPAALPNLRLIDAGCGSGILAISGALLGFGDIFGFDRDPEAVRVSRENLAFNGLPASRVAWMEGGLEAALAGGRQADLLLANIQADVLVIHADGLLDATAPGGTLAMSGILARELDKTRATFEREATARWGHIQSVDTRVLGEWADLALVRPA